MSRRHRRAGYLVVILGVLVVVGALAAVKWAQISALIGYGERAKAAGPPPEAVGTAVSQAMQWESTLSAVGTVASVDSVAVSTEEAGIVMRILFESGGKAKTGQVLVELDASAEQAQLVAAKARRDLAQIEHGRTRTLVGKGAVARQELDTVTTQLASATAEVEALEARIRKKTVRAPFAGKLGIRAVSVGKYLAPGTPVTTLASGDTAYVDFTLPQEQLGGVRVGMAVRIGLQGRATIEGGKIAAIDPTVEGTTRNVKLRARIDGERTALHPGMYARVTIVLPEQPRLVAVPATAVIHAPYGDSVYIVEPKPADAPGMRTTPDGKTVQVVRQQFVRLGSARGDFVAITSGLAAGREVVTAGAFKLRNGVPVVVDNRIQARPELAPQVENR